MFSLLAFISRCEVYPTLSFTFSNSISDYRALIKLIKGKKVNDCARERIILFFFKWSSLVCLVATLTFFKLIASLNVLVNSVSLVYFKNIRGMTRLCVVK